MARPVSPHTYVSHRASWVCSDPTQAWALTCLWCSTKSEGLGIQTLPGHEDEPLLGWPYVPCVSEALEEGSYNALSRAHPERLISSFPAEPGDLPFGQPLV